MSKTPRILVLFLFALMGSGISLGAAIQADDIVGVWIVETEQKASEHIEIYQRDGLYFGKIVWAQSPDESTSPALDLKNKNEELRSRPLVGMEILWGYKFDGEDSWQDGEFYAYKKGKTASPKLTLVDADHLKIQVKILLFKKTFVWPRLQAVSPETPQNPGTEVPDAPSDPVLSPQEDR